MSIEPVKSKKINEDTNKIRYLYGDKGGDGLNNNYVTKEELKILETKINGEFSTLGAKIDGKFETNEANLKGLGFKIESSNKILWWLMGIVSSGVIIPLLAFVFKAIFIK